MFLQGQNQPGDDALALGIAIVAVSQENTDFEAVHRRGEVGLVQRGRQGAGSPE